MARAKFAGIYRIINNATGKSYVGSTNCLSGRRYTHFRKLATGKHHSVKLQRSWDKHGKEHFSFEVLETPIAESLLLEREQHWIDSLDAYGNGYNSCPIAGRTAGWTMPEAQRLRLSEFMSSRKMTPEHRANLSIALTGRQVSEETRKKISNANRVAFSDPAVRARCGVKKGAKASAEARAAMSLAQRASWTTERKELMAQKATGRKHSPEAKAKIAESNRRRTISEETKQRHRIAQLRRSAERAVIASSASGNHA